MTTKYSPTEEELDFAMASMPTMENKPKSTSISKSKYAPTEEEMDFANASMNEPISEEIPWYKSIGSAALKGFTKGIVGLGQSFGGLMQTPLKNQEEEVQREETLNEILPSEEGFIEGVAERGGKILPGVLAGPGGIGQALLRTGIAATSGETAKKLGFGETVQNLAEIPALLTPGLKGKISPTSKQKEIVAEARRLGLSEKEITPLIQSEKKQGILKKFASRGDRTQKILKGSKEAVENLYDTIGASPSAKNVINKDVYNKLTSNFTSQFEKLPDELRKKIAPDVKDLIRGDVTGEKLINFWQDLNHYIKKGDSKLGILKDPILKAMKGVSPEFAKDFQITNQLYARSAQIRRSLSPKDENIVMKFLEATAPYQLIGSVISGYYPAMITVLGEVGARKLASSMLTNPRFQNIGKQMVHAASENKIQLAMNLKDVLKKDLEEDSPEAAMLLDYVDFNPKE